MGIAPGTCLNNYEIIAPLGAGGMGGVRHARGTRLGRVVAIIVPSKPQEGEQQERWKLSGKTK